MVHRRWPRELCRDADQSALFVSSDRIEIADGRARGEPVKQIAARIGKSNQTVYRELARNRKSDGRYQPWFAHNQAYLRRRRVKPRRFAVDAGLREAVAGKLAGHWSPAQTAAGCADAFPAAADGMCAPRPSMRRSIGG